MKALHRIACGCAGPLLLLLLVALRSAPVLADDKCPLDKIQLDQVITPQVRLGDQLTLHLAGLAGKACDLTNFHLRLDGYTFGNKPNLDNQQNQQISFLLERLDADQTGWTSILGTPPPGGTKKVMVAIELPDKSVLGHAGDMPIVQFVIFTGWQLIAALFVATVLLSIVFGMGATTSLLRDPDPAIPDPKQRTFSPSFPLRSSIKPLIGLPTCREIDPKCSHVI